MDFHITLDSTRIVVDRPVLSQKKFDESFIPTADNHTLLEKAKDYVHKKAECSKACTWGFLQTLFPFLSWLQGYKTYDAVCDILGGLTLGTFHIPQGMAFGELAGMDAVHGLYASLFPSLIYVFFGTSRHISIGTFSVVCLMISNVRYRLVPFESTSDLAASVTNNSTMSPSLAEGAITPVEVATTLCFLVGLILLILGIFRLGCVTCLLSDQINDGLYVGAAIILLITQLPYCFGVRVPYQKGLGRSLKTLVQLCIMLPETKIGTLVTSLTCGILLMLVKELISPWFGKKFKIPFPAEFLAIIIATIISHFVDLQDRFDVAYIEEIPLGIPAPQVPRFDLMPLLIMDAIEIALVIYLVGIALAKMFAKQNNYTIDPTQELVAFGITEIVCSFFHCFPVATGRSEVTQAAGSKTQIGHVISSLFILVILLAAGPLFDSLPRCVLSVIIMVSMKNVVMRFSKLIQLWKISKIDCAVWLIACFVTCGVDLVYGLFGGILCGLLGLAYRDFRSRVRLLAQAQSTDIYVPRGSYSKTEELPWGVMLYKMDGPLCYLNADQFKSDFRRICVPRKSHQPRLDARHFPASLSQAEAAADSVQSTQSSVSSNKNLITVARQLSRQITELLVQPKCVILDCAAVSFVDMSGVQALKQVFEEFAKSEVAFLMANCSGSVMRVLRCDSDLCTQLHDNAIFPTVSDAVAFATQLASPKLASVVNIEETAGVTCIQLSAHLPEATATS